MGDWGDAGLQRAIMNSLRCNYSSSTNFRPTPAPYRAPARSGPPPPRPSRDIAPTIPRNTPRIIPTSGTGKRSTLAREGILPVPVSGGVSQSNTVSSPQKAVRTSSGTNLKPCKGAAPSKWIEIIPGGKLLSGQGSSFTLEPSGGQYTSEVGQYLYDFTSGHILHDNTTNVSLGIRTTTRSGFYSVFGIALFANQEDSGWSFPALVLHFIPSDSSVVYATIDRYFADNSTNIVRKMETLVPKQKLTGSRSDVFSLSISATETGSITCSIGANKVCSNLKVCEDKPLNHIAVFASGGKMVISKFVTNTTQVSEPRASVPTKGQPTTSSNVDGLDAKLVEIIESEIVERSPNVQWDDVAGAPDAKRLLNEAIVLPLLVPEFFSGIRTPWKGVLLFGPPGTGKTMLAKAVATCTNTTFFNIAPSTLVSRYHGESEKLAKTLFRLARKYAPATIFLDEADALVSRRGDGQEHEASRRLKSELLTQLDGLESSSDPSKRIMILATTNRPWDLDEAMRRRLEKRIYIPLPDAEDRKELFRLYLKEVNLEGDIHWDELASLTDGYSGADVNNVCRDAAFAPMRRVILGKSPAQIQAMRERGELKGSKLTVTMQDMTSAIQNVPPSVSPSELGRYQQWMDEFGSK